MPKKKIEDLLKKQKPNPTQRAQQGKPFKKKKKKKGKYSGDIPAREEVPANPHGITKKDQDGNIILMAKDGGSVKKFPDLSGDGKQLAGRLATRGYGKARK